MVHNDIILNNERDMYYIRKGVRTYFLKKKIPNMDETVAIATVSHSNKLLSF